MNDTNDNNNIEKQLLKLLFYEEKNKNAGKKLLLRLFAEFILVMFVFTFLSRSADSVTVAQVKMETPQERVIEHKVSTDGRIMQNREIAVVAEEGIQVKTVNVSEGESVKAGDVLMILSLSSLREAIREQRLQIQTLRLTNAGIYNSNQVEQQTRKRTKQRAIDDYNTVKSDGQREVNRAKRAWKKAKQELQKYRRQVKQQRQSKKTQTNNRKDKQTKTYAENDVIMQRIEGEGENNNEQNLLIAVEETKSAYEDALKSYRDSLKTAKRAIEDAEVPQASDNSDKINDLQIAQYQRKLKKLEKLKSQKGKIYAPKAGVITAVGILSGNMTTSDTAFRMADVSNGVKCIAQFSKEDAKYLTKTSDVTLTTDGSDKSVENLSIDTVSTNTEDSTLLDVTVNLSKNQFSIGENVQIEVNAKSKEYPTTVPLNAISEENGKDYVYVARQKDTVLGQEYYAQKVEVTVSDKNGSYAAIEEGGIDEQQEVIISSNKTINNGDRIRKTE